jgi:hypothetical protein
VTRVSWLALLRSWRSLPYHKSAARVPNRFIFSEPSMYPYELIIAPWDDHCNPLAHPLLGEELFLALNDSHENCVLRGRYRPPRPGLPRHLPASCFPGGILMTRSDQPDIGAPIKDFILTEFLTGKDPFAILLACGNATRSIGVE